MAGKMKRDLAAIAILTALSASMIFAGKAMGNDAAAASIFRACADLSREVGKTNAADRFEAAAKAIGAPIGDTPRVTRIRCLGLLPATEVYAPTAPKREDRG